MLNYAILFLNIENISVKNIISLLRFLEHISSRKLFVKNDIYKTNHKNGRRDDVSKINYITNLAEIVRKLNLEEKYISILIESNKNFNILNFQVLDKDEKDKELHLFKNYKSVLINNSSKLICIEVNINNNDDLGNLIKFICNCYDIEQFEKELLNLFNIKTHFNDIDLNKNIDNNVIEDEVCNNEVSADEGDYGLLYDLINTTRWTEERRRNVRTINLLFNPPEPDAPEPMQNL